MGRDGVVDRERIEADVLDVRATLAPLDPADKVVKAEHAIKVSLILCDHCERLLAALAEAEAEVERLRHKAHECDADCSYCTSTRNAVAGIPSALTGPPPPGEETAS